MGVRECIVPRPGKVFAQADYPTLELYCLAQCCVSWIGFSKLADALNAGFDPHLVVAAQLLGMTYEDAVKNKTRPDVKRARKLAKVANFGFPGGLGLEKLVTFARKSMSPADFADLGLTVESAKPLKATWFESLPEMPHYFARINALISEDTGRATVESLFTGRVRGGCTYCAASNSGFQGLGADCAKKAMWKITRASFVGGENSVLFNARVVAFVHDEFILEVDEAVGHECASELARLMVEGANEYLPDVPIPLSKMEPLLMRRWSKNAEQVRDGEGKLIPWSTAVTN